MAYSPRSTASRWGCKTSSAGWRPSARPRSRRAGNLLFYGAAAAGGAFAVFQLVLAIQAARLAIIAMNAATAGTPIGLIATLTGAVAGLGAAWYMTSRNAREGPRRAWGRLPGLACPTRASPGGRLSPARTSRAWRPTAGRSTRRRRRYDKLAALRKARADAEAEEKRLRGRSLDPATAAEQERRRRRDAAETGLVQPFARRDREAMAEAEAEARVRGGPRPRSSAGRCPNRIRRRWPHNARRWSAGPWAGPTGRASSGG